MTLTLVISDKPDVERDAVAAAWEGEVVRLGRFWDPPALDRTRVRLYGADTFCQVLAQKLDVTLVSPPDDFLLQLDPALVKRAIRRTTVGELQQVPAFVKSIVPKLIRSRVYGSKDELAGIEPETEVIVSEIVEIVAEARSWVLDGEVLSIACYEGEAELHEARELVIAARVMGPCVVDVALTRDRGWVVLEANPAWGAGLNGCDPAAAARCIAQATR